jgi:hypothetical protein
MTVVGQEYAPGLQIYEAHWFVRCSINPDTRVSLILMQPQVFGTDKMPDRETLNSTILTPLADYLAKFYPAAQPAIFVRAGASDGDPGYVGARSVGTLALGPVADVLGTSLFIPPLGSPENGARKWSRLYALG